MELAALLAAIEASCDVSWIMLEPSTQGVRACQPVYKTKPLPSFGCFHAASLQTVKSQLESTSQQICIIPLHAQQEADHAAGAVRVQGKAGSDDVQVPAELLLAAQQELKGKAQMAKDLEMVSTTIQRTAAAAGLLYCSYQRCQPCAPACQLRPR